jgi:hypothetical protein
MDIASALTVKNLTPPGYFNLAEDAPAAHMAYITWWNAILARRAADVTALRQLILTPWLVDFPDTPRNSWLSYLISSYGILFSGGTNNQAAALYKLISTAWRKEVLYNIILVLQTVCLPPFAWFDSTFTPQVLVGNLVSSIVDTGFLIYSTASSPATPSPTAYTARAWTTPSGWTRAAENAVSYSRGYLSGGNIVWCAPRTVTDFENPPYFSAGIPVAVPSAGTICIVDDDGTGDRSSVYYSDGTAWRKNSMPNADLGLVDPEGGRPDPEAIAVWSPNPSSVSYPITSQSPPPSDGRTQGYGTFASFSDTNINANQITLQMHQLSGGNLAISTLIELLRRVKPIGKVLILYIDDVEYEISDARQIQ